MGVAKKEEWDEFVYRDNDDEDSGGEEAKGGGEEAIGGGMM